MKPHKRNVKRLQMLERRKNVAKRYLRGETQWEIARAFEVDQATISTDLKAIQKEWLDQAILDRGEWTARELARLDEVERQAWMSWSKSQENAEIRRAKTRGGTEEKETVSKGQAGDPRFLEIVLKCVAKRCELLGLPYIPEAGGDETGGLSDEEQAIALGKICARARAYMVETAGTAGTPAGPGGEPAQ